MDTLSIILLIALLASLALAAGVLVWSFKNNSRVNALSGEKAAMDTELGVVREQLAEAGKSLEDCFRNSPMRRNASASATRWRSGSRTPSRPCHRKS